MNTAGEPPVIWVVAGSDCSGGAGLQADVIACADFGCHACPVLSAVTAQSMDTLRAVYPLDAEQLRSQLSALATTMPPRAIKLGMLGGADTLGVITDFLDNDKTFVVCDPVLTTSGGDPLIDTQGIAAMRHQLLPKVDLLTPNLQELKRLSGRQKIAHPQDIEEAAKILLGFGAKSVLVKGGHLQLGGDADFCCDYWTDGIDPHWSRSPRIDTARQRGTGCTLASAVAAAKARGHPLRDAMVLARMYLNRRLGAGRGTQQLGALPLHDGGESLAELPTVHDEYPSASTPKFAVCPRRPIALYPVVDSAKWVERLFRLGVPTVQLRIKSGARKGIAAEVARSVALARRHSAKLIVNDYWRMAIEVGAWGVHLGQSDLAAADLDAMAVAGLRLGVSVHGWHELARAHAVAPSYIAIGAIFETTSKELPTAPQGLERLARWCRLLKGHYPVVAIGGIAADNALEVLDAGADGIAMISAIIGTDDWAAATRHLLRLSGGAAPTSSGRRGRLNQRTPRSKPPSRHRITASFRGCRSPSD